MNKKILELKAFSIYTHFKMTNECQPAELGCILKWEPLLIGNGSHCIIRRGLALFVGICYYESVKFLKYDSMSNEALFGYAIL